MRVLTYTSLFPSVARPRHGVFVETRLRHLVADTGIDARVLAPVPWFPFSARMFGGYGRFAATPRRASREAGLLVSYPRYLMVPKLGVAHQPDRMAGASWSDLDAWMRSGWSPDLIDAHYFYPDGVAACLLASRIGVPFVVTARGTDVNVIARQPGPARQRILEAAQRAAAVIAVSNRLKESLVELGVEPAKVVVLRNGVDAELFEPADPQQARRHHSLPPGRLALCVGNLVAEKGFSLAIDALRELPDEWQMVIVGDGPARNALLAHARQCNVAARVHLRPPMPQHELRLMYSAADVLLLTSTREGWPNVVLEALACGTPVAGVDVGAVADILTDPQVGRLLQQRDPHALAQAALALAQAAVPRPTIRAHAIAFDWASISHGQKQLFDRAVAAAAAVPCGAAGARASFAAQRQAELQ